MELVLKGGRRVHDLRLRTAVSAEIYRKGNKRDLLGIPRVISVAVIAAFAAMPVASQARPSAVLTCPITGSFEVTETTANDVACEIEVDAIVINASNINGSGSISNFGTFDNQGWINQSSFVNQSSGILTNTGTFSGTRIDNYGVITNASGGTVSVALLTNRAGASFNNTGSLMSYSLGEIRNYGSFVNGVGGTVVDFYRFTNYAGTALQNAGTMRVSNLTNELGSTVTNSGVLSGGGIFNNQGTWKNTGKIDNGQMVFNLGTLTNEGTITIGAHLENGGAMYNSGDIVDIGAGKSVLQNSGTLSNSGTVNVDSVTNFHGTLSNSGEITSRRVENQGTIDNHGAMTVSADYHNSTGARVSIGGALTADTLNNEGLVTQTGTGNSNVGRVSNYRTGRLTIDGGVFTSGSFYNDGELIINAGGELTTGSFVQNSGSTILNGGIIDPPTTITINGGSFGGTGTVIGDLSITDAIFNIGSLSISGALSVTGGTLNFDFSAGGTPNIDVSGGFSLTETTIVFDLADQGSVPEDLNIFDFFTGSSGTFVGDTFQYALADGSVFDLSYDTTTGGLSAVPAVPEPETYAMLLAGLGLIGSVVRRNASRPHAAG